MTWHRLSLRLRALIKWKRLSNQIGYSCIGYQTCFGMEIFLLLFLSELKKQHETFFALKKFVHVSMKFCTCVNGALTWLVHYSYRVGSERLQNKFWKAFQLHHEFEEDWPCRRCTWLMLTLCWCASGSPNPGWGGIDFNGKTIDLEYILIDFFQFRQITVRWFRDKMRPLPHVYFDLHFLGSVSG